MPGSKRPPKPSQPSILDEPWSNPQGTENAIKRTQRALLPDGYPAGLARDSTPETGSIGDASMPITNKPLMAKNLRKGR